jgi:hypothetical protein
LSSPTIVAADQGALLAASEEIIGQKWKERCRELVDLAMERLVNRRRAISPAAACTDPS